MTNESLSPDGQSTCPAPISAAESDSPAVATDLEDSFFETRRFREGGWDGPSKALFIGTLAETGVVTFACRACQMSAKSAYALRHRDPVFNRAWEAALDMARHRLADELLARSLKGSAEQLLRDGCIVGERHHYDNKLAFAILRRLDRQAELGATFRTPSTWEIPLPAPAVSGQWQNLLDALGEGREGDAAALLSPVQHEQGNTQGNNPPVEGVEGDELDDDADLPDPRIWWDMGRKEYRTNFPPAEGHACLEHENFGHRDYHRSLTPDEAELMIRKDSAEAAERRAAGEAERDAFFAALVNPVPATKPRKPPKSEPPLPPNRSKRGAKYPGENP